MPAPLEGLLKYLASGYQNQAADDSTINAFGGDDMLKAAQQYDPNAHWQTVAGGDNGNGRSLVVDIEKLPASQGGKAGYDLRASNHATKLKDPSKVYEDDVYGSVTNSKNFYKEQDAAWTKIAPLLVTMVAPMAGAALAGAGIGGAAGLTAGVTGSGLSGASSTLPSWLTSQMSKLPQTAQAVNEGRWNPMSLLGSAGQAFGINPNLVSGGVTLANMVKGRR